MPCISVCQLHWSATTRLPISLMWPSVNLQPVRLGPPADPDKSRSRLVKGEPVEFAEFVRRSAATDRESDPAIGLQIALYGVAGEAGSVVTEAKKWFRSKGDEPKPESGLSMRVSEELGDLLWYVASVARRLGIDLNQVALDNLEKTSQIWTDQLPPPPAYDSAYPKEERLPRAMTVHFEEATGDEFPVTKVVPLGELADRITKRNKPVQLGDELNDNARANDGYRYHDVLHLAHAAVLGWSPVLRSLMGAKRKTDVEIDRIEDGARAIALEEGLAAFVFGFAEEHSFFRGYERLDWELLKHIRRTVRGLEVADQPAIAWDRTYRQAFDVFRELRDHGGGTVECDLDARQIRFLGGPSQ